MKLDQLTIMFELTELLDELEGTYFNVDYLADLSDILKNGLQFNKNIHISQISEGNASSLFESGYNKKELLLDAQTYLNTQNGYNALNTFINSSISPFNNGNVSETDHKKFIAQYLATHKHP